jgi:hypothetical protein
MMKGEAPKLPEIEIPTCVRWAQHDPVLPFASMTGCQGPSLIWISRSFQMLGTFLTGRIQTGPQKRSVVFSDESAGVKSAGTVAFTEARAIGGNDDSLY